jgi:poly [ADP-ribose] polymerase
MTELGDGNFEAHYGRVGNSGVKEIYPMSKWEKIYKTKTTRKDHPYRDVTDLVSVAKSEPEDDQQVKITGVSREVQNLINFLQSCAKGTISRNYTVAVADVTEKQVDAAQTILDELIGLSKESTIKRDAINKALLGMYTTIPRKMSNTKLFLIQPEDDTPKFQRLLSNEQDLLDIMRGQVATQATQPKDTSSNLDLKSLGLTLELATPAMIAEIKAGTDLDFSKVGAIYYVEHGLHKGRYTKYPEIKNEKLFYHGSRNENWWSILNTGLKIRPANAIASGSMFGDGIYFANKARKSIGYTSLRGSYWASGSANQAFLALYQVNLGKHWDLFDGGKRYDYSMGRLNLATIGQKGYNSVFARGGADLMNDEYIIYEEPRCTVKYLIELKA